MKKTKNNKLYLQSMKSSKQIANFIMDFLYSNYFDTLDEDFPVGFFDPPMKGWFDSARESLRDYLNQPCK